MTTTAADVDLERLGPPDDDPGASRWSAGPALPASRSDATSAPPEPLGQGSQLGLVRRSGGPTELPDASERTSTGRWRRLVLRAGPTVSTDQVDLQPAPTPPELLTPPDFVTPPPARAAAAEPTLAPEPVPGRRVGWDVQGPSALVARPPIEPGQNAEPDQLPVPASTQASLAEPRPRVERLAQVQAEDLLPLPVAEPQSRGERLAREQAEDLLPLPAEARVEPEDPGPPGPFGGLAARDYRYAVADRIPRAIRLLMPAPAVPPEALPRSAAIESGRRRSDLELRLQADRVRRDALEAEAGSHELRRQAAIARDQAYEARATWQWTSHQRAALAEELGLITVEANTVAEEQRRLSEQARQALRDVAAWDAWIGQLHEEAKRLADEDQQADCEAARARAEQGRGQVALLRDWLDRAERRFRQLGAQLEALAAQRDARTGASVEMAARQQLLVDRYQRLGGEAQRMEQEAVERARAAIRFRVEARERVVDLAGLRPDLSRWVNGIAVALVRGGGRHSADGGRSTGGAGRRYDVPAGYRRPLLSEHCALEEALPRAADDSFQPAPEPLPEWLSRLNGVGRHADQSRAQNCVDATLALADTYVRGRPRVAAPRSVDAHRSGTTRLPLRGEPAGRRRLEDAVNGNLQLLFAQADAVQSRFESYQAQAAFDTVADQLRRAGPGAFAVLLAGWPDGGSRSTAAVNYEGAIRWVDAQLGTVAEAPMPGEWVRSLEVLIVDGAGRPAPIPGAPLSPWTTRTASTAYTTAVTEPAPSGFPPPPTGAGPR